MSLLHNFGGDVNITDDYLNTPGFHEILAELPPIKLAFNAVGGKTVTDMARSLSPGATVVTYGGMSKRPISLPFELLNYKNLTLKGFWISQWHLTHSEVERTAMIEDLASMIRGKQLSFLYELHDFDDFHYALAKSQEPFRLRKVVLNMDYPDRMKEHDKLTAEDYKIFEAPLY